MRFPAIFLVFGLMGLSGTFGMSLENMKNFGFLSKPKSLERAYENELLALMEKARVILQTGYPVYNVPVLDPFRYPEVNIHLDLPEYEAEVNLLARDLIFEGLSTFVVNSLSIDVAHMRLDYDFSIPSNKGTIGYYNLLATFFGAELYGEGDGTGETINLRFYGNTTVIVQNDYLFMNDFQIKIQLEAFKSNISGLMGGGAVGNLINEIIEEVVPQVIEAQGELISAGVSSAVIEIANRFLTSLTLEDLIDIITGGSGRKLV